MSFFRVLLGCGAIGVLILAFVLIAVLLGGAIGGILYLLDNFV